MIKEIRHTGIVVKDLKSSLRFYRDLLGFQIVNQMEESGEYLDKMLGLNGVKLTTVKMAATDHQLIELLKYHSHLPEEWPQKINGVGITHIAMTVDNLDRDYNRLASQGVDFNAPPQLSKKGSAKVTFCRAPEGTLIELVEVL